MHITYCTSTHARYLLLQYACHQPYYVYVCIPHVHPHACSQAGFVWLQYACHQPYYIYICTPYVHALRLATYGCNTLASAILCLCMHTICTSTDAYRHAVELASCCCNTVVFPGTCQHTPIHIWVWSLFQPQTRQYAYIPTHIHAYIYTYICIYQSKPIYRHAQFSEKVHTTTNLSTAHIHMITHIDTHTNIYIYRLHC